MSVLFKLELTSTFFFTLFLFLIFLCRPLTEEEIVDLREKHYDSIVEKQKDLDMKIQKEVISLMLLNIFYHVSVYRRKVLLNNILHMNSHWT